jgi:hypothetical protein
LEGNVAPVLGSSELIVSQESMLNLDAKSPPPKCAEFKDTLNSGRRPGKASHCQINERRHIIVTPESCIPRAGLAQEGGGFEIAMVTAGHEVVPMGVVVVGDMQRSASVYKCQCRLQVAPKIEVSSYTPVCLCPHNHGSNTQIL